MIVDHGHCKASPLESPTIGKPETGEFPPKGRAATGPGRQRRRGRQGKLPLPARGRGLGEGPGYMPAKPHATRDSSRRSAFAIRTPGPSPCPLPASGERVDPAKPPVAVVAPVASVHARIGENRRGPLHPGGASLGSRPNSPVTAKPPDDTKAKLHARRTASAERRDRAVHRAAEEASLTRLQQRAASPN